MSRESRNRLGKGVGVGSSGSCPSEVLKSFLGWVPESEDPEMQGRRERSHVSVEDEDKPEDPQADSLGEDEEEPSEAESDT